MKKVSFFEHLVSQWAKQPCIDIELNKFPKGRSYTFFFPFSLKVSLWTIYLKHSKHTFKCFMPTRDRILMQFSPVFLPLSSTLPFLYICFAFLCVGKNHNCEIELLVRLVLNQCLGNKLASIPTQQ